MKKLPALFTAFAVLFSMIPPLSASAAAGSVKVTADQNAYAGKIVNVSVDMTSNPGVNAWRFLLDYDQNVFESVSTDMSGCVFSGADYTESGSSPIYLTWCDVGANSSYVSTSVGKIVSVKLKVKDNATVGSTKITLTYDADDVFRNGSKNGTFENTSFSVTNAEVNIVDHSNHTYSNVTSPASENAHGKNVYTCVYCGDSYSTVIHNYVSKVVAPTTSAQGYTLHTCSVCGESYKDNYTAKLSGTVSITKASFSFSSSRITYTGKAKMPKLTVTYNGKTLVKGTDYKVTVSNSKKVGKATANIKGLGKFTGTKKLYYYVVPVKPTISSVTSSVKKKLTVKWGKDTMATGYQIQVSLYKDFSVKKSYGVSKNTTVKGTVPKLTSGKKYYVRMRAYKTVDGVKKYSAYSAVKSVKVK